MAKTRAQINRENRKRRGVVCFSAFIPKEMKDEIKKVLTELGGTNEDIIRNGLYRLRKHCKSAE